MNEGTLEARIHTELRRILPRLAPARIEHQKIMKIRLGRRVVELDAEKEEELTGRLDILITIDSRPIAILEIKRPGTALTSDDRDQGISYARLLPEMPPIVIITNGTAAQFFLTYNKNPWAPKIGDEQELIGLLELACTAAATDTDNAVMALMDRNPRIWKEIVSHQTKNALADITGEITNLTRPLTHGFSIPRSETAKIIDALMVWDSFIVLFGPPLSGKTNIAQQVALSAQDKGMVPLYIDGTSLFNGVLRHISSMFCRDLYTGLTPDAVRQWILHSLSTGSTGHFVLIIDGWPIEADGPLQADLADLLGFCRPESLAIVLCVDDNTWHELEKIPGRTTKTQLGRKAHVVRTQNMSESELVDALNILVEQFEIGFFQGVMVNAENYQPRLLRLLAASVPVSTSKNRLSERRSMIVLPAVSSLHVLDLAWEILRDDLELQQDFIDLGNAFIKETELRCTEPAWFLFALGRSIVSLEAANSVLGETRIKTLKSQGHISMIKSPQGRFFLHSRIPEFFAAASRICVAERIKEALKQNKTDSAYEVLIKHTEAMPLGDIVAAAALVELSMQRIDCLTPLLPRLIEDRPTFSKLRAGDVASTFFPDVGQVNLHFKGAPDESLIGNTHPWLILSHLAMMPIEDDRGSRAISRKILSIVGDFPHLLRRQESCNVTDMKEFSMHHIPDVGEIMCSHQGIVEPITQAMLNLFQALPDEIYRLVKFASRKGGIPLTSRLITAANAALTSTNPAVAKAARRANASLGYTYRQQRTSQIKGTPS